MCFIESAVEVSSIQLRYCAITINAANKKKNNLLSSRIIRFRRLHYIIVISTHHRVSMAFIRYHTFGASSTISALLSQLPSLCAVPLRECSKLISLCLYT